MISLYELSEFARKSLYKTDDVDGPIPDDLVSKMHPFHEQILNALKEEFKIETHSSESNLNNPLLFVALPEFLLTTISYIINVANYKKGKDEELKNINDTLKINIKKDHIGYLNSTLASDAQCHLNIENTKGIQGILMCHGLSPVKDDSVLLLADIGRLTRVSLALNMPITAMLADTSWMSYNLSSYQLRGLSNHDKENYLNACLSKRKALYTNLGIKCDIKSIRSQSVEKLTYGEVNKTDIDNISNDYVELATCLFGDEVKNAIQDPNKKKILFQTLNDIKPPLRRPDFLRTFSKFPNILDELNKILHPHLSLIREVGSNFSSLESGRFTYFTTQYFAQRDYKGRFLKIAPESEAKFDVPFEHLTECFEEWINKKKFINRESSQIEEEHINSKLSAIYLPHYYFGKYYTLPYTPASGDIIIQFKDLEDIESNVILLNDNKSVPEILQILMQTPPYHRNRLMSDVFSFMMYASHNTHITPESVLSESLKDERFGTIEDLLYGIDPIFRRMYYKEKGIYKDNSIAKLWSVWLKTLSANGPVYIPVHICFLLLDNDDWQDETKQTNCARLIKIAIRMAQELR